MGNAERERARAPVLDYTEPSRAERSRPDGEKWLEGIGTFLYDLTRKSRKSRCRYNNFNTFVKVIR